MFKDFIGYDRGSKELECRSSTRVDFGKDRTRYGHTLPMKDKTLECGTESMMTCVDQVEIVGQEALRSKE